MGIVAEERVNENLIKMLNKFAMCLQTEKLRVVGQLKVSHLILYVTVQINCLKLLKPPIIFDSKSGVSAFFMGIIVLVLCIYIYINNLPESLHEHFAHLAKMQQHDFFFSKMITYQLILYEHLSL